MKLVRGFKVHYVIDREGGMMDCLRCRYRKRLMLRLNMLDVARAYARELEEFSCN